MADTANLLSKDELDALQAGIQDGSIETPEAPKPLLTARELDILWGIAKGFTYNDIADRLGLSRMTVPTHIKNIYRKLEVNSRSEAVFEALERKLIRLEGGLNVAHGFATVCQTVPHVVTRAERGGQGAIEVEEKEILEKPEVWPERDAGDYRDGGDRLRAGDRDEEDAPRARSRDQHGDEPDLARAGAAAAACRGRTPGSTGSRPRAPRDRW